MKISIGLKLTKGPWGGGNQFGNSLKQFLSERGHEVIDHLGDSNIDIILLTDPRKGLRSCSFNDQDIRRYLLRENSEALVVHRINECDERKGTSNVNKMLERANRCADHTVFIASWLIDVFKRISSEGQYSVVHNGADQTIFRPMKKDPSCNSEKVKLVTHHWGASHQKGFDIYEKLDEMLNDKKYSDRFEFYYIGNLPNNFSFKNTQYHEPLSGKELAIKLAECDGYITASRNEPAGMHHIEGGSCGLPVLYMESGALPEYCEGFGISFNESNFDQKLFQFIDDLSRLKLKMSEYPWSSERMCSGYLSLFERLLKQKEVLLKQRRKFRLLFDYCFQRR